MDEEEYRQYFKSRYGEQSKDKLPFDLTNKGIGLIWIPLLIALALIIIYSLT